MSSLTSSKTTSKVIFFSVRRSDGGINLLENVPVLYNMGEEQFRLQIEQDEDLETAETMMNMRKM